MGSSCTVSINSATGSSKQAEHWSTSQCLCGFFTKKQFHTQEASAPRPYRRVLRYCNAAHQSAANAGFSRGGRFDSAMGEERYATVNTRPSDVSQTNSQLRKELL